MSDNVRSFEEAKRALDELKPLRGDGGGPYDSDMERRVKSLEDDMKAVRGELMDIKVTLARIETELGHKVSYKWLAIYFLGLAALVLRSEIAALFTQ